MLKEFVYHVQLGRNLTEVNVQIRVNLEVLEIFQAIANNVLKIEKYLMDYALSYARMDITEILQEFVYNVHKLANNFIGENVQTYANLETSEINKEIVNHVHLVNKFIEEYVQIYAILQKLEISKEFVNNVNQINSILKVSVGVFALQVLLEIFWVNVQLAHNHVNSFMMENALMYVTQENLEILQETVSNVQQIKKSIGENVSNYVKLELLERYSEIVNNVQKVKNLLMDDVLIYVMQENLEILLDYVKYANFPIKQFLRENVQMHAYQALLETTKEIVKSYDKKFDIFVFYFSLIQKIEGFISYILNQKEIY